jgi:hypothetical protein
VSMPDVRRGIDPGRQISAPGSGLSTSSMRMISDSSGIS